MKYRLLLLLLAVFLLTAIAGCGKEKAAEDEKPPEPSGSAVASENGLEDKRILLTLGDSIGAGFGLDNSVAERFSALLCNRLTDETGEQWADCNEAVSGDKSQDLLQRLQNGEIDYVAEADRIVISIGANNVLTPAQTLLAACLEVGTDANNNPYVRVTDADVSSAYRQFKTQADAGVEQLKDDLNEIIACIRSQNIHAEIVFLSIYNPYARSPYSINMDGLPLPLSMISATNIAPINEKLKAAAAENHCLLADVAAAFSSNDDILINADEDSAVYPDPHPNRAGHSLIAQTVFAVLSGTVTAS